MEGVIVESPGTAEPDGLINLHPPFLFWRGFFADARQMRAEAHLFPLFLRREIRQRYKGTLLGWGWALPRPLALLCIFGVAVGIFLGAGRQVPQYAIYIYVGIIGW